MSVSGCLCEYSFGGACTGLLFTIQFSVDTSCIPILPNPALQLPGGAEYCDGTPRSHFRLSGRGRSNYQVPEKAQPITQIPPRLQENTHTQQGGKNGGPTSLSLLFYSGKTFSARLLKILEKRQSQRERMRHEGQTSFKMEKL